MVKAWLNNLYEEGSRKELIHWLDYLDNENAELRAKLKQEQDKWIKFHGERVEARQNR